MSHAPHQPADEPTTAAAPAASPPGTGSSAEAPSWHTLSTDEVTDRLAVDPASGLAPEEAARRLAEHGPNELVEEPGPGPWAIFWRQLTEPLVVVLVAAAVVSGVLWALGEGGGPSLPGGGPPEPLPYDAIVILAIVVLNAILGFVQEYRAEQAVDSLQRMTAPASRVRRGGAAREVASRELVPGDVLLLEAGDRVAADARLLDAHNLTVDESALTGESVPVAKSARALDDTRAELGERANMVFTGSAITYGRGAAVVVATGMETAMGGIASMLQEATDEATPLQRELAKVGRQLGILVLAICVVVAVSGVIEEGTLSASVLVNMFLFGVALAVAAIPEGLPAIVTAVLAIGVRRMAAARAVVRRLPAVETLGSATVICSDKTGTITRNEMTARRALLGADRELDLGSGTERTEEDRRALERLLVLASLNNDAEPGDRSEGDSGSRSRRRGDNRPEGDRDRAPFHGDPTEVGLLRAAAAAGLDPAALRSRSPRRDEIPFSSERKRMTTLHALHSFDGASAADRTLTAIVKGAPEVVLERCDRIRRPDGSTAPLDEATRRSIHERNEAFAEDALRMLAFASRILDDPAERQAAGEADTGELDADCIERNLIWEGLLGLIDPPREGAAASVDRARRAGIRSILITGDHVLTGLAIAREVGIAPAPGGAREGDRDGSGDRTLAGRDVEAMDDAALRQAVRTTSVYGRVRPEHKLRIVRALKAEGEVVAMTGDGVNDAPALKEADIGVAMGISGTDVSREASDMVLTDDDYSTIVEAVAEGRTIFDNIRKFIRYLLSSNAGEVLTMFAGILGAGLLGLDVHGSGSGGGFFLPLVAVQILWINLVTDGAPALALGVDPPRPGLMTRPPRRPGEPVIDRPMWGMIGLVGVVMMVGTLFVLDAYLPGGLVPPIVADPSLTHARTAAFTTLVMFQMVNVFNCLSARESLFRVGLLRNRWLLAAVAGSLVLHALVIYWPPLQTAFDATALSAFDWAVSVGVALTVLVAGEAAKWLMRRAGDSG